MEAVGAASSIIAVVEITGKVLKICFEYLKEVRHAREEIQNLQTELQQLDTILNNLKARVTGPDSKKFQLSSKLLEEVEIYREKLNRIERQLKPKIKHRIGFRTLKWPFESKEVKSLVDDLHRYRQLFSSALQIDQTDLLLSIGRKLDLSKLPEADGAAFDSYIEGEEARCLDGTRVELLSHFKQWADDPAGKCVFWLNGVPGTGKSTLARTMATNWNKVGRLSASFFFKRGGGDRSNARKLFTTIAAQMARGNPLLGSRIIEVMDAEPNITSKALGEQLDKLILRPLSEMGDDRDTICMVIVIDALDECDEVNTQRNLVKLFHEFANVQKVNLKVFLTSRPELPIRLGFKQSTAKHAHQAIQLHDVEVKSINHDLKLFILEEFRKIREEDDRSDFHPEGKELTNIVDMSSPLFIIASTICRFVGDPMRDPSSQLLIILDSQNSASKHVTKVGSIYLPILNRLFEERAGSDRDELMHLFKAILACIVVSPEPLSIDDISCIIHQMPEAIDGVLRMLHSVLRIPQARSEPIRLYHLSFRDFLLDSANNTQHAFSINEADAHKILCEGYIRILTAAGSLEDHKHDSEGVIFETENRQKRTELQIRIPRNVQLASRYWIFHYLRLKGSDLDERAYGLLKQKLFPWLEVMSLVGETSEAIKLLQEWKLSKKFDDNSEQQLFIQDANRFVLSNHFVINLSPSQLYTSCLLFASENCAVKRLYSSKMPGWISGKASATAAWEAASLTIEAGSRYINTLSVFPDGSKLASTSKSSLIQIWDVSTGEHLQNLEGHTSEVHSVALSQDPFTSKLASGDEYGIIKVWDTVTGQVLRTLEGNSDAVSTMSFSLEKDADMLVSGFANGTIKVWQVSTGQLLRRLKGHTSGITQISFSPDPFSHLLASGSADGTINIWNAATGQLSSTLEEGRGGACDGVVFSPNLDDNWLASCSKSGAIRIWNAATGELLRTLAEKQAVTSVSFFPDGDTILSAGKNSMTIWDTKTGQALRTIKGQSGTIVARAISSHPNRVVFASMHENEWYQAGTLRHQVVPTIKIWDVAIDHTSISGERTIMHEENNDFSGSPHFSPDGSVLARVFDDEKIELWDIHASEQLCTLRGRFSNQVELSPDGKRLASFSSDATICIWDTTTGEEISSFKSGSSNLNVCFSPNGMRMASWSGSTIEVRDVTTTSTMLSLLKADDTYGSVDKVSFSLNGLKIASFFNRRDTIVIWDISSCESPRPFEIHCGGVHIMSLSPDGKRLAAMDVKRVGRIWNAETGELLETSKFRQMSALTVRRQLDFWNSHPSETDEVLDDQRLARTLASKTPEGPAYSFQLDWVIMDAAHGLRKVLWLPPEWRDGRSKVHGETIALCSQDQRVAIITINRALLDERGYKM